MPQKKPKPMVLKNYLTVARASAGSQFFRKCYFQIDNRPVEVLRDGDLSCAFFVSAILKLFNLIKELHTTVVGTERDCELHGWREIKKPKPGAIIVWGPKKFKSGETHKHIGIFLGAGKAVSNNSKKRSPSIRAWDYRPVERILWNEKLN